VTTSEGVVKNLTPEGLVMSLILPAEPGECVRETFGYRSLFFQSEQAASPFLVDHPEAMLLSVEEAALVGRWVAQSRFTEKPEEQSTQLDAVAKGAVERNGCKLVVQ
jgi:hypothetical protein